MAAEGKELAAVVVKLVAFANNQHRYAKVFMCFATACNFHTFAVWSSLAHFVLSHCRKKIVYVSVQASSEKEWTCANCACSNFESRIACRQCQQLKPGSSIAATSAAGPAHVVSVSTSVMSAASPARQSIPKPPGVNC
jgi:hypothetical protein